MATHSTTRRPAGRRRTANLRLVSNRTISGKKSVTASSRSARKAESMPKSKFIVRLI